MVKHICKTGYNLKIRVIICLVFLLVSLLINIYNPSNTVFSPALTLSFLYLIYFFNVHLYGLQMTENKIIIKRGFVKTTFVIVDIKAISYYNNVSKRNTLSIVAKDHKPYYIPVKALNHLQIARILNALQTNYAHIDFNFNLYEFMIKDKQFFTPFNPNEHKKDLPRK